MGDGGLTITWLKLKVFQNWENETEQTRVLMPYLSFKLNTVNLNQKAPNYYYP